VISRERLERVIGAPVAEITHIEPWAVVRCRLADSTTVIVKWQRSDPNDWRTGPERLHTECAALQFLATVDETLAPRLITAEFEPYPAVVVLEDLAPREPLREIVVREGVQPDLLRSYVRTLARMHAATANRVADWPLDPAIATGLALNLWQDGARAIAEWGIALPPRAEREIFGIVADLSSKFGAFTNGDAQLNNYMVDRAGDGRLIDFEVGGFQSVFFDLANLYVPGPMWMTVNIPEEYRLEELYRAESAVAIPEIADDEIFDNGVAGAGFVWALRRLAGLDRFDARAPGDSSRPHRVATLEAAADVAERKRCLPYLADWARMAAAELRRRWPDADIDLVGMADYTSRW
jgi:hypothetical protein